jgi:ferrous iron transport protein B
MSFVGGAGKVILLISLILWVLQSFGPSDRFQELKNTTAQNEQQALQIAKEKLELSYAGQLGKSIEPIIQPLGFDWKIGISLITSFAAREVFVGTMSTIYALEETDHAEKSLTEQLRNEINPVTGKRVYSEATVWSLLIFYAFAMQCMSTLAVTKKETNSWKWPLIQLGYLTALAYLSSLLVYQWLA